MESLAVRHPANPPGELPRHRDENGQGMVEYALILFLVAIVGLALVGAVGEDTLDLYTDISNAVHAILG